MHDDEQNQFDNGWTCDHYIGAVLVFCPDGTIPIIAMMSQAPFATATLHWLVKFKMSWRMYTIELRDYALLIQCLHWTIICFLSNMQFIERMIIGKIEIAKEATSMFQSSEWGIQAFQASFPQIKDQISLNTEDNSNYWWNWWFCYTTFTQHCKQKTTISHLYTPKKSKCTDGLEEFFYFVYAAFFCIMPNVFEKSVQV